MYPYGATSQPQPAAAATLNVFPMTAREWRVLDQLGRPFAAGVQTVGFAGVNGVIFAAAVDAADYADWQPIPFDAAAWGASAPNVYAAYR